MAANLFRVIVPTDDMERADAFWRELLELEIDPIDATRHYLRTAGAILALVDPMEHGQAARPNPDCIYFRVPDLDASYARALALGAAMSKGYPAPGIAVRDWGDRSFYCADPFGNPICLVDDASEARPEMARYCGKPIANLSSIVLPTVSLGRTGAFYEEILGLEADTFVPGRHFFFTESCVLTLVNPIEHARAHEQERREFRPNPDHVYFGVSDLDVTFERAQKLQMEPLANDASHDMGSGIQVRPWGERSFYGCDPSGNPICFVDEATLFTGSQDWARG